MADTDFGVLEYSTCSSLAAFYLLLKIYDEAAFLMSSVPNNSLENSLARFRIYKNITIPTTMIINIKHNITIKPVIVFLL